MERCDFSSISTCLKNQISESNQMNQPDFLYELFEDFMNDPINEDFSMDNGLICKLRSNGMPVPLLRNCYSIFNGTKYR